MEVIQGGRRAGKTTELIKIAAERFGYIVCHSREEAHRIHTQARILGYTIPYPITYHEFIQGQFAHHNHNISGFCIDYLLNTPTRGVQVEAIILSTNE